MMLHSKGTSASSSAVKGVKQLKVKYMERGFPNSGDEKLGRFKINSRGEGPLLDNRSERSHRSLENRPWMQT